MDPLYVPLKIRTVSGQYVNVFDPDPETLLIEDIAHALSMQPRFGGHSPVFYSVAEHCIWMAEMMQRDQCPKDIVFEGLMHDASEAFLVDIPKPIKLELPDYNRVEDGLMITLAKRFNFKYPLDPEVKEWDKNALEWEWENIVLNVHRNRPILKTQLQARNYFLHLFHKLKP